jgi:hypothetical protein
VETGQTTVVATIQEDLPAVDLLAAPVVKTSPQDPAVAEAQPVMRQANLVTDGKLNVQEDSDESTVSLCVMHGCWTFKDFLSSLDECDLAYAEEDLRHLCNSIRKEIMVITRLQTQLINIGQKCRAAELEARSTALNIQLPWEEMRHKTACTLLKNSNGLHNGCRSYTISQSLRTKCDIV